MENKSNKEISVCRCPHCRSTSHVNEWILLEDKGNVRCPKCSLLSSTKDLKRINVELFRRGRIWVNIDKNPSL